MNTVIENLEEALINIRNAMNSIHKNIDVIMKEDSLKKADKALLEDFLNINKALLSDYNFTERLMIKINDYKKHNINKGTFVRKPPKIP